ncbi:MAG: fibronectin type III domain-containing protein, partial [Chloroflexi bacterium]|nr:fibronectin type III domain-containing protein [Chloroflexota bacterium]
TASLEFNSDAVIFHIQSVLHLSIFNTDSVYNFGYTISTPSLLEGQKVTDGAYVLSGQLSGLSVDMAGIVLNLTELHLSKYGFSVTEAQLQLPDILGGTLTLENVHIGPSEITFDDGELLVNPPDIDFGGGSNSAIKLRDITLRWRWQNQNLTFLGTAELVLNLPDNANHPAMSITFVLDEQQRLSAELDDISLNIAGATLALSEVSLSDDGLGAAQATLSLPSQFGSSSITLSNVRIGGNGLEFETTTLQLADITFGGGPSSALRLTDITMTLEVVSGQSQTLMTAAINPTALPPRYQFSGQATLVLDLLDGNPPSQTISLIFKNGNLQGTISQLDIPFLGETLQLNDVTLSNQGLLAAQTIFQLPESIGGSITFNQVRISAGGLDIDAVGIQAPDITFGGDGSVIKIAHPTIELGTMHYFGSTILHYRLLLSGILSINVPGLQVAPTPVTLHIRENGDLGGFLDTLDMTILGMPMHMEGIAFNNNGLTSIFTTITLPPELEEVTLELWLVSISNEGISMSDMALSLGGQITLLDGEHVNLSLNNTLFELSTNAQMSASRPRGLAMLSPHTPQSLSMQLTAEMVLDIDAVDQITADVRIRFSEDGSMEFEVLGASLELQLLSTVTLSLQQVSWQNGGLHAGEATLQFSQEVDNASVTLFDVVIDENGLSLEGGGISLPDFRLGGEDAGFLFTGAPPNAHPQATLERWETDGISNYRFTIEGRLEIDFPGGEGSATGVLKLYGSHLRAELTGMSISVAGLSLSAEDVSITGSELYAYNATISVPFDFGGGHATLYGLRISPDGISIEGGDFALPDIEAGGFRLGSLRGYLRPIPGGYEIGAQGYFSLPNISGAGGCEGIEVGLIIGVDAMNQTVVTITPLEKTPPIPALRNIPSSPDAPTGVYLKEVSLALTCTIPIGNTGFNLTRVSGTLTLNANSTHVELTVSVASAITLPGVGPAARLDGYASLDTSPFNILLGGALYLFEIQMANGEISIWDSGARVTAQVDFSILHGEAEIAVWADPIVHFAGRATVSMRIKKGQIWSPPWPIPDLPPWNIELFSITLEVGEFTNGAWGFKGELNILDGLIIIGIYVDTFGNIDFGDVSSYRLLEPPHFQALHRQWLQAKQEQRLDDGYLRQGDVRYSPADTQIDVTVPHQADVIFTVGRTGDTPALTLLSPDGILITPDNLPDNVSYMEFDEEGIDGHPPTSKVLYSVKGAQAGTWLAILTGDASEYDYGFAAFGPAPTPTFSDLALNDLGDNQAQLSWRLDAFAKDVTISAFANADAITVTLPISGTDESVTVPYYVGQRLMQQEQTADDDELKQITLDLSSLPGGEYHIWIEADDGNSAPVRHYLDGVVTVSHTWQTTWQVQPEVSSRYRQVHLSWQPHPNPDVDSYTVHYGRTPAAAEGSVDVGALTTATLNALDAGATYTVIVEARDEDSGRVSRSQAFTIQPLAAPFTLTANPLDFSAVGGQSVTTQLHLSTDLDPYPAIVSLSATSPNFDVQFSRQAITPTLTGVSSQITITPTRRLPSGPYTLPLIASGGGVTRTLTLSLQVQQPGLALSADPDPVILASGESRNIQIAVSSLHGSQDEAYLALKTSPPGLQVSLDQTRVQPGTTVTLTMTDTQALAPGEHALVLQAVTPYQTAFYTATVQAIKGGYGIEALPDSHMAAREQVVAYALTLNRYDGDNAPVTLTLAEGAAPPQTQAGFSPIPASILPPDLLSQITLNPGESTYLLVRPGALAPLGSHTLLITTSSTTGDPAPVALTLTILEAEPQTIYFPLVQR